MTPSKVLEYCQQFGEFLTIKIENMTLQHNDKIVEMKPKKKYGIIAVGSGAGLIETFKEMGVDVVIDGGQTNNPSTKSFIDAFEEICAENIFVFPNNSNIIMTANEAKELYLSSNQNINIFIINTKNIGEGYSALCVFDRDLDSPVELEKILIETIGNVVTGQISKSIRNAVINHVSINKDDYIGFSSKTMISSNQCRTETYYDLVESLGIKNKSFVINITGKDVNIKEQLQIEKEAIKKDKDEISKERVKEIDENLDYYENVNPLHLLRSMILERTYSLINFEAEDPTKVVELHSSNACAVDFPKKGEITFTRLRIGDMVLINGLFEPYIWVHQNTIKIPKTANTYSDGVVDKLYAENVIRYYFVLKDR